MNPDIEKERRSPTFDVEKLINIIDGSPEATARKRQIQDVALKEPLFTEGEDFNFLSREEQYDRCLRKGIRMWDMAIQHGYLDRRDMQYLLRIAFPSENPPNGLHWVMFLPTLQSQASDEQKQRWLPRALKGELVGTYAQTEMGHGTALRNIETTATYDPETESFILNSPTLTSIKWWPGGLGITCNCCVLMANLIIKGRSYGMHPFFVQYRSLDNHQTLPGVTAGDIGPKFGYNSIDNGFLRLDHFRIPREDMLMKHAKVLRDGTYVSTTSQKKPSYGVMTLTRVGIIERNAASGLAAAVTIAIRYSAVRRQSELNPRSGEPQILEYRTQQHKLFPYLAMSYGFKWAAGHIWALYDRAMEQLQTGSDVMLPEIHALSSGMKAFCTNSMAAGIEQCRLSCGGHGYSCASGLPKLYVAHVPGCTFEGENTVLQLQTARYLMKCFQPGSSGSSHTLPDSVSYLHQEHAARGAIDTRILLDALVDSFRYRAALVVRRTHDVISASRARGLEEWEARNDAGVELVRASDAHCEAFIIQTFVNKIRNITDPDISHVMTKLCQLLGVYWMLKNIGDYLEVAELRQREGELLAEIRPAAVPLVDAFDFPDHYLCSALGRYDGQVYPAMYDWALKSPLNTRQLKKSRTAAKL